MNIFKETEKELPILVKNEVIIAGGGCAGTMAAIASARLGIKTLLVERFPFLGGAVTAQHVPLLPVWNLTPWANEAYPLIGGLAQEICIRLEDLGGTILPDEAKQAQRNGEFPSIWFYQDPELSKLVIQEMCEEAGVEILLNSYVADAIVSEDTVRGIIIENKSGRQALKADIFIDATGDGDLAYKAGAKYEQERKSMILNGVEKGVLPVSYYFNIANVNTKRLSSVLKKEPDYINKMIEAKAPDLLVDEITYPPYGDRPPLFKGRVNKLPEPYHSNPKYYSITRPQVRTHGLHVFGCDITNGKDLSSAELELRRKSLELFRVLKKNVPGYEEAYISNSPTEIGLRESRRIVGDYMLTEKDILGGKKHKDVITRCRIGEWDINETGLPRKTPELCAPFDIPYRCITPRQINGLLVAGRCISMTHSVAGYFSPRDVATCWGLGEAAGIAAALSLQENCQLRDLEIGLVQKKLRSHGFNI